MNCTISEILTGSGSIRTKVWICVLIALAGYFIATISSLYANQEQAARLANLQNIHFPLARLSDETDNAFKAQTAQYETALLSGEADQANQLSSRILDLLQLMAKVASQNPALKVESSRIKTLADQYKEFSRLAAKIYPRKQASETDLEMQKNIQMLAAMQHKILEELNSLTQHLFHNVEQIIQDERQRAQSRTVLLGILFTLVLLSATLISRCFANRQLIAPLDQLQDMVTRFTQNREISQPPDNGGKEDEINALTAAFWRMTQELRQTMVSRDYVDNIIKHMSGCLMVLASDLTLRRINDNTKTFLGFQEEELLGRSISEFVSVGSKELFKSKGLDALTRGQDVSNLELSLLTREKTEIPVLFSASVMRNTDQQIDAIICVAYDITQRKKTEEILRKIEVERALARTASLAAIGELTSSIAHEMRNPLSSIKMNAKMMEQLLGEKDATLGELAEITSQQSLRLETMLNDLLNYGKPLTLYIGKATVRELFRATQIAVTQEKQRRDVLVEINNETGEIPLQVDIELMTQALSNLALNAIQWSPPKGVVHISAHYASSKEHGGKVIFQVMDNGPGIRPEKLHRLFQPFFSTRPGGTGLGLASVRKITEYHGGTVSGANRPEGGAVFRIVLPLLLPPDWDLRQEAKDRRKRPEAAHCHLPGNEHFPSQARREKDKKSTPA